MREIKFRGWDKNVKAFVPFSLGFAAVDEVLTPLYPISNQSEGEDIILMQYTGLKDSTKWEDLTKAEQSAWIKSSKPEEEWNGKEIYEGDVVNGLMYNGSYRLGKVVFDDGGFIAYPIGKFAEGMSHLHDHCEIIGNIYENPELLEKEI